MKKVVGFDQKLQLHQLDYIARELTRIDNKQQLYEVVDQFLMSDITGTKARLNARTILFKIWVLVGEENLSLRDKAIGLFENATKEERLLVHWGLMILAYPFLKDISEQTGRLLQLQSEFSSVQLSRKIFSLYGERRRVSVSIGAALGTLKHLDIIKEEKKIYSNTKKITIKRLELKLWILKVLFRVTDKSVIELKQLQNEPIIFPFSLQITESELRNSEFQVIHQGIDMVMVELK